MSTYFKAICSMTENRAMGLNNDLVCRDKRDFEFFKTKTRENIILMGRKTFESIGKPLPYRFNIVISRQDKKIPGAKVIHNMDEIHPFQYTKDVYIIGGARLIMSQMDRISDFYLTVFHKEAKGDVFIPPDFERHFYLKDMVAYYTEFEIRHYINPKLKNNG